jgi:hypothetical protein
VDRHKSQSGDAGLDDCDVVGRHLPLRWVVVVLVLPLPMVLPGGLIGPQRRHWRRSPS